MSDLTTLILMAKDPRPGHVKTRLSPPLTPEQAADVALAFVADLGARLASVPDSRLVVALPPGDSPDRLRGVLAPSVRFASQGPGNLGQRLQTVLRAAFDEGASYALVLGSDHPNLPTRMLLGALEAARAGQVGWVPTRDGGYACLALPRPLPGLFESVPWSTPAVASATRNNARAAGVSLLASGEWYDIDTFDDLRQLHGDPDSAARCPQTMDCLDRLGLRWDEKETHDD